MAAAVESAQAAVGHGEQAALAAEAAHAAARKNLDAARIPLADAERAVQRLDTEAKTLMKLLAVETESMWPPVIDKMTVEKGYEIALGAALGDDLDAPVDQSHAMRWMGAAVDPSDPALPDGVQAARPVRAGAAGAGAASCSDRRGRARRWRATRRPAQARPAPGFARRRSLALGRLCRRRPCADRRRAPARATQPPVRHR